jgi:hypothetical protein
LGDWWIIITEVATDPKCFIMKPDEVRKRAVRDGTWCAGMWLPAKQYNTNEFREAWHRIARGDVPLMEAACAARADYALMHRLLYWRFDCGETVLDRLLHLFEGASFDLAHALARYTKFVG